MKKKEIDDLKQRKMGQYKDLGPCMIIYINMPW